MSPRALSTALVAAAAIAVLGVAAGTPAGAVGHTDVAPASEPEMTTTPSGMTPASGVTPVAAPRAGGRAERFAAADSPAQVTGSFDNLYAVDAGGSVTDTLGALGADDLLVYATLTVGPLDPAGAGTLTASGTYPSGTFTFVAAEGFAGRATAEYVGETADGERLTASVVFDVAEAAPPNHPPVANPDVIVVTAGDTASVSPLANDTDPDDGDLLTLVGVSPASRQGVTVQTAGTTIRARAAAGAAAGTRRFTYTIADRAGATATGTLRVTVRTRSTTSTTSTTRPAPPPTTPVTTPGRPPVGATTVPAGRNGPGLDPTTTSTTDDASGAATTSTTDATEEDRATVPGGGASAGDGSASTSTTSSSSGGGDGDPTSTDPAGSGNPVAAGIVLGLLSVGFVALVGRRRLRRP